jgi:outer membrane protein insertion porin family
MRFISLIVLLFLFVRPLLSQETEMASFEEAKEYEIGGVEVIGSSFSDANAIVLVSGLRVGDKIKIPGPDISRAIKALWKLKLFTDIEIRLNKTLGDVVFLELRVTELPRLSRYAYKGVKKSYHSDLNTALEPILVKGGIVTDNTRQSAISAINRFFIDKGFLDVKTSVTASPDDIAPNATSLMFQIDRGKKVKIQDIRFTGNSEVKASKLRKKMKNTKKRNKIFASSKLVQGDFREDKKNIIQYYNKLGYRDARILNDTIWRANSGHLIIQINLEEGKQYYFRNITWKGNTLYEDRQLSSVLGIEKGDIYNQELMETRLRFSQDGRDISSLYMDDGYLFFQVEPTEVAVQNDSIDIEMRIFEGPQATIDRVTIKGNDRTHEHVIRRELRTLPGQKFSRQDIIRSQRQIINLGYFNPENVEINPQPNLQRGTVDIDYKVEEKPSDQLELSAGYSAFSGVIGTLGVTFNNFSMRNIFNKKAWTPMPQGDGQRFSIRLQSNGRFFQAYNISLTEPWLGGKKPTSFTVAGQYNRITTFAQRGTPNYGYFAQGGINIGLGTRLSWPDDNFIFNTTVALQNLQVDNYLSFFTDKGEQISKGSFNNLNVNFTLTRTTVADPIFPRDGSKFSVSLQVTPPYSLLKGNIDFSEQTPQQRYRWLEYHKWKIEAEWYKNLFDKLVFRFQGKIGLLGNYNSELGTIPFERYELGGDGLTNQFQAIAGREIISSRGYAVDDLPANRPGGALAYNKFTAELRYPISLNPNASIYVTTFAQGINAFARLRDYNPFDIRRSAGMGLRVFLPMFGTLGFDYGIGFDKIPTSGSPPYKLTDYGRFNIILGFEPE